MKLTEKKIRRGDTFGAIMEAHGIDYPEVHTIVKTVEKAGKFKATTKGQIATPCCLLKTVFPPQNT